MCVYVYIYIYIYIYIYNIYIIYIYIHTCICGSVTHMSKQILPYFLLCIAVSVRMGPRVSY